MGLWEGALWGMLGGVLIEGVEFRTQMLSDPNWSWRRPIPQGWAAYVVAIVIRVGIGAGLAAAAAAQGMVSGPYVAMALGVSAPLVVEKLFRAGVAQASALNEPKPAAPVAQTAPAIEGIEPSTAQVGGVTDAQ